MKIEFERVATENAIEKDDGGQSLTFELSEDDRDLFVRILSWDPAGKHQMFRHLIGKTVKVTIEYE